MDWKAINPELNKKLDPAAVKPAPQGKFGDYVDGYHVVSEANRIFGFGNAHKRKPFLGRYEKAVACGVVSYAFRTVHARLGRRCSR